MSAIFKKAVPTLVSSNVDKKANGPKRPLILAVGEVSHWHGREKDFPKDSHIAFVEYSDIGPELLNLMSPDIVLSPLLCGTFDCIDLATILSDIGFLGLYRVLAPDLPRPQLIVAEVRSYCPSLDFDIILSSGLTSARLN